MWRDRRRRGDSVDLEWFRRSLVRHSWPFADDLGAYARGRDLARIVRTAAVGIAVALASVVVAACGSHSDGGCQRLTIDGAPFSSQGTATVQGTGTLPAGVTDGLGLNLMVNQGSVSVGVLPDNFLANDAVCGATFDYKINKLEAGTYRLKFEAYDHQSADAKTLFSGTSTESFTVTDGQMLTFDATFQ